MASMRKRYSAVSHGRRTIDTFADVAPHLDVASGSGAIRSGGTGGKGRRGRGAGRRGSARRSCARRVGGGHVGQPGTGGPALCGMCGLPVPEVLVGADDMRRGKPDPEGYLTAARRLGVSPGRCLVIEDTPAGIEAGRAAGCRCSASPRLIAAEVLRAAVCIPDFKRVRIVKCSGEWSAAAVADWLIEAGCAPRRCGAGEGRRRRTETPAISQMAISPLPAMASVAGSEAGTTETSSRKKAPGTFLYVKVRTVESWWLSGPRTTTA